MSNDHTRDDASSGRSGESEPVTAAIRVHEQGAAIDGKPQTLDARLYVRLLVLQSEPRSAADTNALRRKLCAALDADKVASVVYEDLHHPRRLGLLTWSQSADDLIDGPRAALAHSDLSPLEPCPTMTMLGRTYSTGYEPDLGYFLLRRPVDTVLNESWPWAVWYPLRRKGAFGRLEGREQGTILREHAQIGRAYGEADLAHDVRLACHGLDTNDNDFVIGLIGANLHRLSHVVQAMRKTRQTAEYIESMGPFFVGRAAWRSPGSEQT